MEKALYWRENHVDLEYSVKSSFLAHVYPFLAKDSKVKFDKIQRDFLWGVVL